MPMLNRDDDHHAFHEDAKPGDLWLRFPVRCFIRVADLLTADLAQVT